LTLLKSGGTSDLTSGAAPYLAVLSGLGASAGAGYSCRAPLALQLGPFLRHNGAIHRAHLLADAAVNADVEGNPVETGTFGVSPFPGMNAGNRAGVNANRHPFTAIRENCVGHWREGDDAGGRTLILG